MSDQVPIENQQQIPDQIQIDPTTTNNNDDGQDYSNKMEQVEQEAAKLREQLQAESTNNGVSFLTDEQKRDSDSRSIYIGNVDYGTLPIELQQHFSSAGVVSRVTIMTDKITGQAKGFAYLEFVDAESVQKLLIL